MPKKIRVGIQISGERYFGVMSQSLNFFLEQREGGMLEGELVRSRICLQTTGKHGGGSVHV